MVPSGDNLRDVDIIHLLTFGEAAHTMRSNSAHRSRIWYAEKTLARPVSVLDAVLWHFGVAMDTY
jgi:hypothetical protein